MSSTRTVLVVTSNSEDLEHARACLPEWSLEVVTPDDLDSLGSTSRGPSAILFHARGDEDSAGMVIKRLRSNPDLMAVPVLLIVGRYEIGLRSAIANVSGAAFVIAPYTSQELQARLTSLLNASEAEA